MSPRAVVTGAAGFIGSHLTDRLLSDGWTVIGIDSFEDYYDRGLKEANVADALRSPAFTLVEDDLVRMAGPSPTTRPALRDLVADADAVFHLAAQAGVRASWGEEFPRYVEKNVLATQMLLECAKAAPPRRLVYASSSSVYGDVSELPMREDAVCRPFSPYGVTKLAAEHLCRLYHRNFGLPAVSCRLFTVYGPRQRPDMAFNRFVSSAMAGEPIALFGDGAQTRDFTYVSDIVDGLVRALDGVEGAVYNLGGGSRVSMRRVIDALATVMGAPIDVRELPSRAGDVHDTWASIDAARAGLGYEPSGSLEEGLRAEYEWLSAVAARTSVASPASIEGGDERG